jgi:hypothetical protein
VGVLVMRIVNMRMGMFEGDVPVLVLMAFSQVQPDSNAHQ